MLQLQQGRPPGRPFLVFGPDGYNPPMRWRLFGRDDVPSLGESYRLVHEAWLTRAMRSGRPYPRIPLRKVEAGGFSGLMKRPGGRALADTWWTAALDRVDD